MLRQRTIIQVGHRKHPLLYKQEHTYLIWDVNGWHSTYLLDLINQKYSVTQVHNNGHRFPPKHCRRCQKIQTLSDFQLLTCISQSTKDLIRPNYPDIGLFSESSIEENTCLFLTAIADHRQPMWNIVQNFKEILTIIPSQVHCTTELLIPHRRGGSLIKNTKETEKIQKGG